MDQFKGGNTSVPLDYRSHFNNHNLVFEFLLALIAEEFPFKLPIVILCSCDFNLVTPPSSRVVLTFFLLQSIKWHLHLGFFIFLCNNRAASPRIEDSSPFLLLFVNTQDVNVVLFTTIWTCEFSEPLSSVTVSWTPIAKGKEGKDGTKVNGKVVGTNIRKFIHHVQNPLIWILKYKLVMRELQQVM